MTVGMREERGVNRDSDSNGGSDSRVSRRDWLAGATAVAATWACAPSLLASTNGYRADDFKVDTHQHLWDLSKFRLPWTDGSELLGKSFVVDDYKRAIEGTGIRYAVYMEVGMEKSQQVAEAEWVVELCAAPTSGTLAGVIAGQPYEPGFKAYVERFAQHECIKGIRHLLHTADAPPGTCRTPEYRAGVQLLGELGLRFDLCVRPQELSDAFALAESCPETRFVLDHCGNADVVAFQPEAQRSRETSHDADDWRRNIERLASLENVICKISGIIARVDPQNWNTDQLAPIVNHCLDCFGKDRVIFASDWPVCLNGASLAQWVEALEQITAARGAEFQAALFRENAIRFYDLKLPA